PHRRKPISTLFPYTTLFRSKIKVVKNKIAPPFREAMVDIMFGEGISKTGELLTIAVNEDIVKKSGSWFSYNDEKIGQGTEKARTDRKSTRLNSSHVSISYAV